MADAGIEGSSTCCVVLVDTLQVPTRRWFTRLVCRCEFGSVLQKVSIGMYAQVAINSGPFLTSCSLLRHLQGRLTSANIGDSGFIVVGTTVKRGDLHIKYRSPQQEHQFGYPYQLGHMETADHPQDAMLTHISVIVSSLVLAEGRGQRQRRVWHQSGVSQAAQPARCT